MTRKAPRPKLEGIRMTEFETELEIFRKEEESAQQFFFSYLSVRSSAAGDPDILRKLNENALFWITAHHSMLVATFVTLGRIFDQDSKHNIDRLMGVVARDLSIFSLRALQTRKEASQITAAEAAQYVVGKHALSADDVKRLRKQINVRRRIYEDRYRDIRHKVFAHKATADIAEVSSMFAKTNIEEMKSLFGFLHSVHEGLWEAFHNGRRPDVKPFQFTLPSEPPPRYKSLAPGERTFREGYAVLRSMLPKATEDAITE